MNPLLSLADGASALIPREPDTGSLPIGAVQGDDCPCARCSERRELTRDAGLRAGERGVVSPTQVLRAEARR